MNEKRLDKQDVWMDGWMDKKNQGGKGNPSSILLGIQIYTGICPTSHCDILIHPFTHISNHSFFNLSIYPFIRPFIQQSSPPSIFFPTKPYNHIYPFTFPLFYILKPSQPFISIYIFFPTIPSLSFHLSILLFFYPSSTHIHLHILIISTLHPSIHL